MRPSKEVNRAARCSATANHGGFGSGDVSPNGDSADADSGTMNTTDASFRAAQGRTTGPSGAGSLSAATSSNWVEQKSRNIWNTELGKALFRVRPQTTVDRDE